MLMEHHYVPALGTSVKNPEKLNPRLHRAHGPHVKQTRNTQPKSMVASG